VAAEGAQNIRALAISPPSRTFGCGRRKPSASQHVMQLLRRGLPPAGRDVAAVCETKRVPV